MSWPDTARVLCVLLAIFCMSCSPSPQLPPLPPQAVVLAFGDSLTAGTGAGDNESYPAVLAQLTGLQVVNAGIPGEISASGLQRLPELLEREKPALLILCHGGNDLLGKLDRKALADNLRAMIRLAREKGVAVMLIAVPSPDLALKPPPLYGDVAREFGIPVVMKALQHILGKSSLKSDHIHPNASGYRQLAEAIAAQLKKSGALN